MCRSSFPAPPIIVVLFALAACVLTAICGSPVFGQDATAESSKLVVTIDGEKDDPILLDDIPGAEENRILDVEISLKLGAGREFHFTKEGDFGDSIYVTTPGEPKRLVGVRVMNWHGDEDDWVDQLSSLSDADVRGLWGVEINYWSDKLAKKLEQLNLDQTCITIGDLFQGPSKPGKNPPDHPLPPLPKGTRNLVINSQGSDGFSNLDELRKLPKLRSLQISWSPQSTFDCSLIEGATQLESLQLFDCRLTNADSLNRLTQVRQLSLTSCRDLTDISYVKSMRELKSLYLDFTQVVDLSPLSGLTELRILNIYSTQVTDLRPLAGLVKLRKVDARVSKVSKLPAQMPNLRELNVIGSDLNDDDVRTFQQQNLQCRVYRRWNQSLQQVLNSATSLQINSGGSRKSKKFPDKTLFESKNAAEIKQLIAGIVIDEAHPSGGGCFCRGYPTFVFYDGDKLLASLSFHHGQAIRWNAVWAGDEPLAPPSGMFLVEWLANRGMTEPLKQVQERERRRRSDEKELVRATSGLSPALAKIIKSREGGFPSLLENFHSTLILEQPKPSEQTETLLRLYGTSNEDWNSMAFIQRLAEEQLRTYDVKLLASAVESGLTGSDRQQRRGAARFWKDVNSPLEKWDPENAAKLHRIVVLVEQEARYYALRIEALTDLKRWKNDFTAEEIDQRLATGLCDPVPQVRRYAMIVAGRLMHKPSIDVLMSVLKGNEIESRPLPDVPLAESEDVSGGHPEYELACSEVDAAALALGYLDHAAAKPLIEAIQPRSAMCEVALALLGDGNQLKPEHFGTGNLFNNDQPRELQQELQLAAIQVVIRSKGRYGLKLSFGYETVNKSREEKQIFDEIGQMLRSDNAQESDHLVHGHWHIELERWFDKHGAEYLKRFDGKP